MIIVNFKTYRSATGEQAVELAQICEKVSKESGIPIIVVVQNIDLFHVSQTNLAPADSPGGVKSNAALSSARASKNVSMVSASVSDTSNVKL